MSRARNAKFDSKTAIRSNFFQRTAQNQPIVISVANVRATYVIGGRLYADVDDWDNGAFHPKCPVMCLSGDKDKFVYAPVVPSKEEATEYNEAILIHRDGGKPYVIGMKQPIGLDIKPDAVEDPGEADRTTDVSKDDIALVNKSSRVILDSNGAVTIVSGDAKYVRVQLQDVGGRLRISRGGEADETVILANAFLDTWVNQTLYAHLQAQNARISALEAQVASLSSILSSGLAVVGETVESVPVAVAGNTVAPSGLSAFTPPVGTAVPTAGAQYKSGTIQLSEKSEASNGD